MSKLNALMAVVIATSVASTSLVGCAKAPTTNAPITTATAKSAKVAQVLSQMQQSKEKRDARAKQLVEWYKSHDFATVDGQWKALDTIADTDSDIAYEFLVETLEKIPESPKFDDTQEKLIGIIDGMTPDQLELRQRADKAKAKGLSLEEYTAEEIASEATTAGAIEAKTAQVGRRNRLVSWIVESKLFKACNRAWKNTKRGVKNFMRNIWRKFGWGGWKT